MPLPELIYGFFACGYKYFVPKGLCAALRTSLEIVETEKVYLKTSMSW